jgi:MFS superfamily sulfate permease-like transporter
LKGFILELAPAAAGVMLVGFAEGLGAAKTYATRHHYEVDPNRELLGLGAANVTVGLSSGMVVNGSLSKTATGLPGRCRCADRRSRLRHLAGPLLGVVVSLLLLLYRISWPHIATLGKAPGSDGQWADLRRHPQNEQAPGVVVLRPEAGLFFANADTVRNHIRAKASEPGTKAVVLDSQTMPFIDVTAARMLMELAADLERQGVRLLIARDIGQVREVISGEADSNWVDRVYPTVEAAVEAARDR